MSDWHTKSGPASFRGVQFLIKGTDRGGGRRNVKHVYPFKEAAPYDEDMGMKGRTFPVEGFVVGVDYLDQRDALLAALEKPGPGELIHPTYGTKHVVADEFRVRESTDEGGVAYFSITFNETSTAPQQPTTAVDSVAAVASSAAAAKSAVAAYYQTAFSTVATIRDGVTAVLRGATNAINSVLAGAQFVTQTASQLSSQVQDLSDSVLGLASSPGDIVTSMTGVFESLADAVTNAPNVTDPIGLFLGIYGFNAGPPSPQTTEQRVLEAQNVTQTQLMIQRLALISAAQVAVQQTFVSYDDAIAARTRITDLLDEQSEIATDETYPQLLQLRADLVKAVPGDGTDLPHLIAYTPSATLPSLVVSQRLYGDVDGEADLVTRNKVHHPGFVAGGVELEVLSRGQ